MEVAYAIGMVAASVWVCLPLIYWFTAPEFYKTFTGRTIMMLLGATSAMFFMLLTFRIFGNYTGREYVNGFIYILVFIAGIRTAVLFFQLRFGSDAMTDKTLTTHEKQDNNYGTKPNSSSRS